MISRLLILCLVLSISAAAVEKAAYDSTGRIIALLSDREDLEVTSSLVAVLPSGKRIQLQTRTPRSPLGRDGQERAWFRSFELPDESQGRFRIEAAEGEAGVNYSIAVTAERQLELAAIEFVLDLPRKDFAGGRLTSGSELDVKLPDRKPPDHVFYRGEHSMLRLFDATGSRVLDLSFEHQQTVSLVDRWEPRGRSYQLRAEVHRGALAGGSTAGLRMLVHLSGSTPEPEPASVRVDLSKARYEFDGFGGNYCWNNQSPVAAYTLSNLKVSWARTEMKLLQWDKERDCPGAAIAADMEMMQRFHKLRIPYVISIWWLPERLYSDPYEKPRREHFRRIDPEKWDELLDLAGSYLLYAKRQYGVEPDLFSFNEANIGVYVGLNPEEHAAAIKRFGAHFQKLGLKTKLLLGDATGPRDTHNYVLAAAADAEAMRFVGAVGFHSWGGATAAQYTAWGDVAEWLGLPLLVTELGVDAAAYNGRAYDSYHYGLREARMTQEIMQYARPQGTQFWQFTNDYGLTRLGANESVEPTARFWLMKHFTDLTPQLSQVLTATSSEPHVLVTAFRAGSRIALQVLNLGGAREANFDGLPDAEWSAVQTTETAHYKMSAAGRSVKGSLKIRLAPRSLVTLTADTSEHEN